MLVVVRDLNDGSRFKIEDVEGFIPINFVCKAPKGATLEDSEIIDVTVDEVNPENSRATLSAQKRSARDAKRANDEAERERLKNEHRVRLEVINQKLNSLQSLNGKSLSVAEIKQATETLISLVFADEAGGFITWLRTQQPK